VASAVRLSWLNQQWRDHVWRQHTIQSFNQHRHKSNAKKINTRMSKQYVLMWSHCLQALLVSKISAVLVTYYLHKLTKKFSPSKGYSYKANQQTLLKTTST